MSLTQEKTTDSFRFVGERGVRLGDVRGELAHFLTVERPGRLLRKKKLPTDECLPGGVGRAGCSPSIVRNKNIYLQQSPRYHRGSDAGGKE